MIKKITFALVAIGLLVAGYILDTRYNETKTRSNAEWLIGHGAAVVCDATFNVRLDVPIADGANKALMGALGDTRAKDLVFVDLSNARFKFSLRDPAHFRQGLRGGDDAMHEYEKLLAQRVFKRTLDTNGDVKCSSAE